MPKSKPSPLFAKSPHPSPLSAAIREVTLRAETIDEESRSVEAVVASEDKIANLDLPRWETVDEILLMRGAEVPDQVVLFDAHPEMWGMPPTAAIRGSVREMKVVGKTLVGRVFFAKDQASFDLWSLYRDGHARDVSVGIERIETHRILPGQKQTIEGKLYAAGKRPLHVTTRWRPKEVSTVPWGADPKAKVRQLSPPEDQTRSNHSMNPRLLAFLRSLGLRAEATDEDAQRFQTMLEGRNARIADVLESETQNETAGFMARAALRELGVNPDDPTKPLSTEPAQPAAGAVRGQPPATPPTGDPDPHPSPLAPQSSVDPDAIRAEERARYENILAIGGTDLTPDQVRQAVREGWDEARIAREALGAIRSGRTESVGAGPPIHSRSRETDMNVRSLAAGMMIGQGLDPIKHSMFRQGLPGPGDRLTEQDADLGHSLRGMSAPDLFRECLRIDSGRSYRTIDEALDAVRSAAGSGGTLAYVFGTNVYARLLAGWETVGDTTVGWCDEEDVANFLQQEDITFSGSSRLERLPRGDTAKHATVSDTRETYQIYRYAKQFVVDEQDIIDDRLGALMGMVAEMGEAARRVRPDLVYALFLQNPTMADTGAVFNATATSTAGGHANLGTTALSSAALTTAIRTMGTQRDGNSNVLNITPTHLIVPPDLQWTARTLTEHQTLVKLFADSSDPLYSMRNQLAEIGLTPISDARLDATGVIDPRTGSARTGTATNWFLIKAGRRGVRVAYRRGTGRRPQLRRKVLDGGQWGLGWDINLDIGALFADWRGVYKSSGDA